MIFKSLEIVFQIQILQQLAIFVAQTNQSPLPSQSDSLIDKAGENAIYIGLGLFIVMVSIAIGILNRRVEYAILFSLVLAGMLMFFLWTV
ncbi:MAG: hypothetical protein WBA41_32655 [Rivularia sp. (in: cyanobacteria)]